MQEYQIRTLAEFDALEVSGVYANIRTAEVHVSYVPTTIDGARVLMEQVEDLGLTVNVDDFGGHLYLDVEQEFAVNKYLWYDWLAIGWNHSRHLSLDAGCLYAGNALHNKYGGIVFAEKNRPAFRYAKQEENMRCAWCGETYSQSYSNKYEFCGNVCEALYDLFDVFEVCIGCDREKWTNPDGACFACSEETWIKCLDCGFHYAVDVSTCADFCQNMRGYDYAPHHTAVV